MITVCRCMRASLLCHVRCVCVCVCGMCAPVCVCECVCACTCRCEWGASCIKTTNGVWLATGCGCKEVYRFSHPTPLVSVLFAAVSLLFLHFF